MNPDIPKDPFMLLSLINMNLRDSYESLDELCSSMDIEKEELISTLSQAGFDYMPEINQFR